MLTRLPFPTLLTGLAEWRSPRRRVTAPSGVLERVYVPLQPAILPVQRLPETARYRSDNGADGLQRALQRWVPPEAAGEKSPYWELNG